MNTRIKKIRKTLDLTQQVFAERIGMKQNSIALIESGKRNISDQAILSICREFNVEEEWLRTGKGEMFKPKPTDILDQLAYKYKISNADYVMIEKFLSLRSEIRKEIFDYFHEVAVALEDMEPHSLAYNGAEAPYQMDQIIQRKQEYSGTPSPIASAEAEYEKRLNIAPHTESTASNITKNTGNKRIG